VDGFPTKDFQRLNIRVIKNCHHPVGTTPRLAASPIA
jgi:hypothetical protein